MTSSSTQNGLKSNQPVWSFVDAEGTFRLENPGQFSRLYFPLANEKGLLSTITPKLKGSTQIGHDAFLTLPMSAEDLHASKTSRNFWVRVNGGEPWSVTGVAKNKGGFKEKTVMEGGFLWHRLTRQNQTLGLESQILSFIPASGERVEILWCTLKNTSDRDLKVEATAAVPLYARSADSIRDHRHVTSLLHRIRLNRYGVLVSPTMIFDERGHRVNRRIYTALGFDESGLGIDRFYPTVESFIGEGGSFEHPKALFEKDEAPADLKHAQGKEAMGAFRFKPRTLAKGQSASFHLILGIAEKDEEVTSWIRRFRQTSSVRQAFKATQRDWLTRSRKLYVRTGDPVYDGWLRWVSIQPVFRKLFGNSFLPDFDYGRGGRGWRDLWQDCLALLLTQPEETRALLLHNFGGVRVDGSNATIIGSDREFIADRNQITRVWMDHGVWPLTTTELYIHESGDIDFLLKEAPYFRDPQFSRGKAKDAAWTESYGTLLKTRSGKVYRGTLIEHLLIQHLVQFFNVGPHNHIRLEDADWNDGLDMAGEKGESVAFTAFYGGNLARLASLLEYLGAARNIRHMELAKELTLLLDAKTAANASSYNSIPYKTRLLEKYFETTQPRLSGQKVRIPVAELVADLHAKSSWIGQNIRQKEFIRTKSGHEFFNGYYDNKARRVEGDHALGVRMTLTGQVFPIMSGVADSAQIAKSVKAIRRYLKDSQLGGVRLNTDFREIQPHLGRAFSFAYGEKENGAFFNHMQIMLANALYRRGFVAEGYEVLKNIFKMCVNTETSKIYPGIPEYFNSEGRGMYHYLTGSASWYCLTLRTEVFGVQGHYGDLLLQPKLTAEQFAASDTLTLGTLFAGRRIELSYHNPGKANYGRYRIEKVELNGRELRSNLKAQDAFRIPRSVIERLSPAKTHSLKVSLVPTGSASGQGGIAIQPDLLKNLRQKSLPSQKSGAAGSPVLFRERKLQAPPSPAQLSYKHL